MRRRAGRHAAAYLAAIDDRHPLPCKGEFVGHR